MSYCGGPTGVSNNTNGSGSLPVGNNAVGNNSPMQAPNDPGIGSSRPEGSSGALNTDEFSKLQQRILKVEAKVSYFQEQFEGAKQDLNEIINRKPVYIEHGNQEQ
ncbi:MAG: hypothetical protein EOP34_02545 [Rickettsiales bacterium]|nr:MAG: hypothetical protein EOP34_02545 [Rickettsiales bacterium]